MIRFGKILFILLPFIACGCLEMSQEIVVNKDGGGKIIESVMMSKAALDKITSLFSGFLADPSADGPKSKKASMTGMYDKKKLIADAANYGPGVKYVSSKKVNTDTKEGYEVEYSFNDINSLQINQNPAGKGPSTSDSKPKTEEENIKFKFKKGNPATLTVIFPDQSKFTKEKNVKMGKKDKASEQKAFEGMREILQDLYIGITVRPVGKIVETNATYNDNGKITLLEMDFNKLTSDEKQFESFAKKDPQTVEEAKLLLNKLQGFKVELNQEVIVKFE